jgi:hypothetical protein
MSDNSVEVKFGAETSGLKSGTNDAAQAVEASVNKISSVFADMANRVKEMTGRVVSSSADMASGVKQHTDNASSAFSALNGKLLAITALIAGGAMFKGAVQETSQFTSEAVKLSKALGISATEASTLNVALGDIYASAETMTSAAQGLARQLRTNEQAVKDMGLRTRDANGNLRSMSDLIMDSIKILNGYKDGVDRTIAAQRLFGRSAADVMPLLKLTSERLEEAKKKQQELGLIVGSENVEANLKYKAAMNDVGDVLLAVKKIIGDSVMPILTRLGDWFSTIAPPAVFAFKIAVSSIATVVIAVMGVIEAFADVLAGLMSPILAFGRAMKALLSGDMTTATKEMENMWSTWGDNIAAGFEKAKQAAKSSWADIQSQWGKPTETKPPSQAGKTSKETDDSTKTSRMSEWENRLSEAKLAYERENDLREMSKQQEIKYWEDLKIAAKAGMDGRKLSKEEDAALTRKILTLELDMNKEAVAQQLAAKRSEMEGWKNNMTERLRIAEEAHAITVKRYGAESKEALIASIEIAKIKKSQADQEKKAALDGLELERNIASSQIDFEQQLAQQELDIGLISKSNMLEQERGFEERRYAIKQQALDDRMALLLQDPDANPDEIRKTLDQILQLRAKHAADVSAIQSRQALESNKYLLEFSNGLQSGFQTAIGGILNGTMSLTTAIKNLANTVKNIMTDMMAKMAAEWIGLKIKEMIFGKAVAQSTIAQKIAEAGAGGVASMAAAPFPLNLNAVAFGAAMSAAAGTYGATAFAEQGYDIPSGVNPVTQLHQKEMVLPAQYADVIRNMAEGGGTAGAQSIKLELHPDAMRMTLNDWLQGELARMAATR